MQTAFGKPDPRLCTNRLACNDYRKAYAVGKNICEGCKGSLEGDRAMMTLLDEHLDKLISQVFSITAETFVKNIVQCATDIRLALADEGMNISGGEIGMLMNYRLCQRLSHLETQARIAALK